MLVKCSADTRHHPPWSGTTSVRLEGGVLKMPDSDRVMKPAKALFAYSLLYLFAIFAAYLADSVVERALAMGGA